MSTDPKHFSLLREQQPAHQTTVAALLHARLPIYEHHLGRAARLWLEVGPGNSALAKALSALGRRWTGVEFDEDMALFIRSQSETVVHANFAEVNPSGLMTDQELANGGFDIVVFSQVLEHVRTPATFLRNAFAALRPGGLVHIDVPNDCGLTATIRRVNPFSTGYGEIVPPHHMIAYSASALRNALETAGFSVIDIFSCAYDDDVFGLAHAHMNSSRKLRLVWALSRVGKRGGNLVALARRPA